MDAKLKYVLITVSTLKVGYIVLIDGRFWTIKTVDCNTDLHTIEALNGEVWQGKTSSLINVVVKFIAIVKNKGTYPIIHGDFTPIVNNLHSKGHTKCFIHDNCYNIQGHFEDIATYPRITNSVEIIDSSFIIKHFLSTDTTPKIGTISGINKNMFNVVMQGFNKTHVLKRSQFTIIGTENSKKLFKLEFKS